MTSELIPKSDTDLTPKKAIETDINTDQLTELIKAAGAVFSQVQKAGEAERLQYFIGQAQIIKFLLALVLAIILLAGLALWRGEVDTAEKIIFTVIGFLAGLFASKKKE